MYTKDLIKAYAVLLILSLPGLGNAADEAETPKNKPPVAVGINAKTSDTHLGSGEFFLVGFDYFKNDISYLRLNVGAKVYQTGIEIISADSFFTFPVEAIYYMKYNNLEFGAGVMMHLFPSYKQYLFGFVITDIEYDSGLGYLFQINYILGYTRLGLRYEKINYSGVDASSMALIMEYMF